MNPYQELRQSLNRPLFIPFTVVGDPNPEKSLEIILAMIEGGADALELGFPYSDPPADGAVIQAADKRALDYGISITDCFEIISELRKNQKPKTKSQIPIGLLVYYNIIFKRGIDTFYNDCKNAGVTSVLIADLPLEHSEESVQSAKKHGIQPVFLVSELTTDARLEEICKIAEGYLYLVSYVGITGLEDGVMQKHIAKQVTRIRTFTDLPICVGFGISTPAHVKAVVASGADGVIVGSRIVQEVPNLENVQAICQNLAAVCF